jgi:Arc/MetJ-type ribon-helix-helix transcriptional regulator
MPTNVHELRPKSPETEKITINLGYVDLGHVDLMVQDGFYSNRTDFIRTAIRNQLERHADVVKQSTARKGLDLGLRIYTRADLEAARQAGEMLHINVLGLATIAQDVTADLARASIASVSVLGTLHATPAVKALSPTGQGEYDVEPGHTSRSHTVDPGGAIERSHRAASAHVARRARPCGGITSRRSYPSSGPRAADFRICRPTSRSFGSDSATIRMASGAGSLCSLSGQQDCCEDYESKDGRRQDAAVPDA